MKSSVSLLAKPAVIRSITIAINAITMPATRLSPKRALRIAERTSQPTSEEPPMIEAITTIENAAIVV